jgi:hypothetical protein
MATLLKSALQILSLAVEADNSSLFDEAARLYDRGSRILEQYLHSPPPSLQAAAAVKSKLESYQQRSQYIKSKLNMPAAKGFLSHTAFPSQNTTNEPTSTYIVVKSSNSHASPIQSASSSQSPPTGFHQTGTTDQGGNSLNQTKPMTDLQLALDLAKQARDQDDNGNFASAFSAYKKCIDCFVRVIRTEPNDLIRSSLTKTAKIYITRAEQLKDYLSDSKTPVPSDVAVDDHEVFETQIDLSDMTISEAQKMRDHSDPRVGPLAKEKSTSFWNDSGKLHFRVDIGHNLITPSKTLPISVHIDNRTSVAVACIKVYLEEIDTSTYPDKHGTMQATTSTRQLNKCQYVKQGVFPLANGVFDGSFTFEIPAFTRPTDADHSSTFAREHILRLQCDIPRHKNLILEFPIRVTTT